MKHSKAGVLNRWYIYLLG